MAKNKVTVFDEPEKIDAIINTRLQQFTTKGGHNTKNVWPDEEIELRDAVILQYITEQGLSRLKTAQQIMERWDISLSTAKKWVKEAIDRFCNSFDETDKEKLKKMFVERIETILQSAIDDNSRDSALKALDLYGKTFGFFKDNKEINLNAEGNISFDFQ